MGRRRQVPTAGRTSRLRGGPICPLTSVWRQVWRRVLRARRVFCVFHPLLYPFVTKMYNAPMIYAIQDVSKNFDQTSEACNTNQNKFDFRCSNIRNDKTFGRIIYFSFFLFTIVQHQLHSCINILLRQYIYIYLNINKIYIQIFYFKNYNKCEARSIINFRVIHCILFYYFITNKFFGIL